MELDRGLNDHFDQDGLIGIFAILNPEYALRNRGVLIDIAEAGDFAQFRERRSARISITIAEIAAQITNEEGNRSKPYPELCGILYATLLGQLKDIIENVEPYRGYWETEDDFLQRTERSIESGFVKIVENSEMRVAIVDIPIELPSDDYHWATIKKHGPVHEMAIHNKTNSTQILYRQGDRYWFQYRYEGWVNFQSRPIIPRVDLTSLNDKLTAMEQNGAKWTFSGASDLVPVLRCSQESSIPFSVFLELLGNALRTSPVAWNPYS